MNLIPFGALGMKAGGIDSKLLICVSDDGRDLLRLQVARKSASVPLVIANPFFGNRQRSCFATAKPVIRAI